MTKTLSVILFAGLCLAAAAEQTPRFQYRKSIELGQAAGEEIITAPLDGDVYTGTRDGFPDLRIVDDRDEFIPYLLEQIGKKTTKQIREHCASKVLSLRVDEGKGLEIVVALDEKAPCAVGITIQTPLVDYEHRVRVFGWRADEGWTPVVTNGVIFDYSRFMDIRNCDVALPSNEYRRFKVVVEKELEDRESPLRELIRGQEDGKNDTRTEITRRLRSPFRIDRVELWRTVESEGRTEPETFRYEPQSFRVEHDAKSKVSRIEIQSGREPLTGLSIATASRNFSRDARVLVPVVRGVQTDWIEVGRGRVVNIQFRAFHRSELRVDFAEQRQERYRLEVENADNPPLAITAVEAVGSGYQVVFLGSVGGKYRLEYGSETAAAPSYDAGAVLASVRRGSQSVSAKLGPQVPNAGYRGDRSFRAFLNSPIFLILSLVIMVLVLAWALLRAGKRIKRLPHGEV